MKLAVMQPYFFPYIGYWRLIHAADTFVLLDDVQYIRHGWINRNRIMRHGGGWQYILMPLRKHSKNELIKNIHVHSEIDWTGKIIGQLAHYNYKKAAPFYDEVIELLTRIFCQIKCGSIGRINEHIINEICRYLDIRTKLLVSSDQNYDYGSVSDPGDWALRIAEQTNAREYINPASGAHIFDPEKFCFSKVKLSFLNSDELSYSQRSVFQPSLSIVDVLMFNGKTGTRGLLEGFSIESAQ